MPPAIFSAARTLIDLILASFLLYRAIVLIRGTRSVNVILGLMLLFFLTQMVRFLDLTVTSWLLEQIWLAGVLLFVIVFQPEIRQALAELGKRPLISSILPDKSLGFLEELTEALRALSEKKTGALIALEQENGLKNLAAAGISIHGDLSKEILLSIFDLHSPLHDGAVIVGSDGRLAAARCLIPISEETPVAKGYGARHQAALALSETSDALVLVVSEQTGAVSLARNGKLDPDVKIESAIAELKSLYQAKIKKGLLRKFQEARIHE